MGQQLEIVPKSSSGRKENKLINKIENLGGEILETESKIVEEITVFFEKL